MNLDNLFRWIIGVMITAIVIATVISVYSLNSLHKTPEFRPMQKYERIRPHWLVDSMKIPISVGKDSTDIKIQTINGDSLHASLQEHEMHLASLEQREEHLINDMRQEVNNSIDKMNAWFAVWIAVLALMCGLLPVLFQYRAHDETAQHINDERERIQDIANQSINRGREELRLMISNANDSFKEQLKDVKDNISDLNKRINDVSFMHLVNSIMTENDCQVMTDAYGRDAIQAFHINGVLQSFEEVVQHILPNHSITIVSGKEKQALVAALIHLYAVLDLLSRQQRGNRKAQKALCKLRFEFRNTIRTILKPDPSNPVPLKPLVSHLGNSLQEVFSIR